MTSPFKLKPRDYLDTPARKRFLNEALFSALAARYAFINRVLSFNRDLAWKRRLIEDLPALEAPHCLDLACGTGDLTFLLARRYPQGRIVGLDLTEPMLAIAREKNRFPHVEFVRGDMGRTDFPVASFEVITGGYALRNAADLGEVIREIHRLLAPGGIAAFLDFSKPANRFFQCLELFVLRTWSGFWGGVFHRNPELYTYIADSLQQHPDREELRDMFRAEGFEFTRERRYYFGFLEAFAVVKKGEA